MKVREKYIKTYLHVWVHHYILKISGTKTLICIYDFLAIGADILDSTYQNTFSFGRLKEEPTWFELDRLQRKHFDSIKTFNEYLREEYHSLQDLLWNSGQSSLFGELPKR